MTMMKTLLILLAVAASMAGLSGCGPVEAKSSERVPENGAQFKKDVGLSLTDTMKQSIGLKLAEVEEKKVAPSFTVPLSAMPDELSGWLTSDQAKLVEPGMEITLQPSGGGAVRGTVKRKERVPYATLGDFEVTVEPSTALPVGARVPATFRGTAGEAVTCIPRSALLKTAEGHFVYAVNGEFYVRTAVKVGAMSDDHVEITDGLYSGDQVVVSPVMSLWLAELQVLRGGKACTCGH
jgi:hypothetical protein